MTLGMGAAKVISNLPDRLLGHATHLLRDKEIYRITRFSSPATQQATPSRVLPRSHNLY